MWEKLKILPKIENSPKIENLPKIENFAQIFGLIYLRKIVIFDKERIFCQNFCQNSKHRFLSKVMISHSLVKERILNIIKWPNSHVLAIFDIK